MSEYLVLILCAGILWFVIRANQKDRARERARQARLRAARELTAGDRSEWVQGVIQWMDETFR